MIGEYTCHFISSQDIIVMAVAERGFDPEAVFIFLNNVQEKFMRHYGDRASSAIAYAMNNEFSVVLSNEMRRTNSQGRDKLTTIQQDVDQVKVIMNKNIEAVLERGEKMDTLIEATDDLASNAGTFRRQAVVLQRNMW